MSMDATLQVRMDAEMKERVEKLYRSMGTTFAEAVRMMAAQSLIENGMPFKSTVNSSRAFGIAGARANPELIPMQLIDANVILRYLLNDSETMSMQAKRAVESGAYTTFEVMAEVPSPR